MLELDLSTRKATGRCLLVEIPTEQLEHCSFTFGGTLLLVAWS